MNGRLLAQHIGASEAARQAPAGEGDASISPIRTSTRTFTLCADDYALAPGVSRGILEAIDAGAVTATSAMTNSPAWPEDAAALVRRAAAADIGLHLTLTSGRPLTRMPRLAPTGTLPPLGELMRRVGPAATRGRSLEAEIEAEIEAQADRFTTAMGRAPDHVDGHQHVHVLPAVRRPLLAVLRRRGWTPWLRDSGDGVDRILRRRSATAKALGLAVLAHGLGAEAAAAGLATNRGFAGFSRFDEGEDYGQLFERYLVAPGPRHLVMCHPGYIDETLRRLDPVVATRERELRFLLSPNYPALLARRNLRPSRLSSRTWRDGESA